MHGVIEALDRIAGLVGDDGEQRGAAVARRGL